MTSSPKKIISSIKINRSPKLHVIFCLILLISGLLDHAVAFAQKDLGNGFYDHGTTSRAAYRRGVVTTADANGRNIILSWLFDHRGAYTLLLLDAETGKAMHFDTPFPNGRDAPFASIISKNHKYYTLFNGYFSEFDPVKKQFTAVKKTSPRLAMSMLEDAEGNIWATTYPKTGLIKFSPQTGEIKDYGFLYTQNWAQYPRHLAADNNGWIYIGIGTTRSQIIAFNTKTEKSLPLLAENERQVGTAYLYRGTDGQVYAKTNSAENLPWMILDNGTITDEKSIIPATPEYTRSGDQGFIHKTFPNGDVLDYIHFTDRYFTIQPKEGGAKRTVKFDYKTEGSWSLGVITGPDGKLYGGTAFPMQLYSFDPATDSFRNFSEYSQLNAMTTFNGFIYSGGYPRGDLIQYDPLKPWIKPSGKPSNSNPAYLFNGNPIINRPHRIKGLSDKKTIVLSGTPAYGHTGGGLLIWNTETKKGTLLKDSAVVVNQSTLSITELPGNKILGGTTIAAGTGGEVKAAKAVLYIMDMTSKKVIWQDAPIAHARVYTDLCLGNNGMVYGFVNSNEFFVFDPNTKQVLFTKNMTSDFGHTTGEQSPRVFLKDPKGNIYILFRQKIARINQQSHEIELIKKSPVAITAGGDFLNGKIYFLSESHLFSYHISDNL